MGKKAPLYASEPKSGTPLSLFAGLGAKSGFRAKWIQETYLLFHNIRSAEEEAVRQHFNEKIQAQGEAHDRSFKVHTDLVEHSLFSWPHLEWSVTHSSRKIRWRRSLGALDFVLILNIATPWVGPRPPAIRVSLHPARGRIRPCANP